MNALTKTASVCADVFMKKVAASIRTDRIMAGVQEAAVRDDLLKAMSGKDGFPTWAKITAALGGGKLLLDSQGNKSRGWRDR